MKTLRTAALLSLLVTSLATAALAGAPDPPVILRDNWALQSAADVRETGAAISTPAFRPAGWYRASVPTTVLAALVKLRVYPDPPSE